MAIPSALKLFLTSLFVVIYTSSQWLDGQTGVIILFRPPQPKTKFLYFPEMFRIYRLIAYSEAALTNLKSICDFTIKYLHIFYEKILDEKGENAITDLKREGIQIEWIEALGNIRNDVLHNYATWIAFRKTDTAFDFVHVLPKSLNSYGKQYKKFKGNWLDTTRINKMINDFQEFSKKTQEILFKKIKEKFGV